MTGATWSPQASSSAPSLGRRRSPFPDKDKLLLPQLLDDLDPQQLPLHNVQTL